MVATLLVNKDDNNEKQLDANYSIPTLPRGKKRGKGENRSNQGNNPYGVFIEFIDRDGSNVPDYWYGQNENATKVNVNWYGDDKRNWTDEEKVSYQISRRSEKGHPRNGVSEEDLKANIDMWFPPDSEAGIEWMMAYDDLSDVSNQIRIVKKNSKFKDKIGAEAAAKSAEKKKIDEELERAGRWKTYHKTKKALGKLKDRPWRSSRLGLGKISGAIVGGINTTEDAIRSEIRVRNKYANIIRAKQFQQNHAVLLEGAGENEEFNKKIAFYNKTNG